MAHEDLRRPSVEPVQERNTLSQEAYLSGLENHSKPFAQKLLKTGATIYAIPTKAATPEHALQLGLTPVAEGINVLRWAGAAIVLRTDQPDNNDVTGIEDDEKTETGKEPQDLSRRQFLKRVLATGTVLAGAGILLNNKRNDASAETPGIHPVPDISISGEALQHETQLQTLFNQSSIQNILKQINLEGQITRVVGIEQDGQIALLVEFNGRTAVITQDGKRSDLKQLSGYNYAVDEKTGKISVNDSKNAGLDRILPVTGTATPLRQIPTPGPKSTSTYTSTATQTSVATVEIQLSPTPTATQPATATRVPPVEHRPIALYFPAVLRNVVRPEPPHEGQVDPNSGFTYIAALEHSLVVQNVTMGTNGEPIPGNPNSISVPGYTPVEPSVDVYGNQKIGTLGTIGTSLNGAPPYFFTISDGKTAHQVNSRTEDPLGERILYEGDGMIVPGADTAVFVAVATGGRLILWSWNLNDSENGVSLGVSTPPLFGSGTENNQGLARTSKAWKADKNPNGTISGQVVTADSRGAMKPAIVPFTIDAGVVSLRTAKEMNISDSPLLIDIFGQDPDNPDNTILGGVIRDGRKFGFNIYTVNADGQQVNKKNSNSQDPLISEDDLSTRVNEHLANKHLDSTGDWTFARGSSIPIDGRDQLLVQFDGKIITKDVNGNQQSFAQVLLPMRETTSQDSVMVLVEINLKDHSTTITSVDKTKAIDAKFIPSDLTDPKALFSTLVAH